MRIAILLGGVGAQVIKKVRSNRDDLEFMDFDTVEDLIKDSMARHIFFERIVLSENVFISPEEPLSILNTYISENSSSTSVIFITKTPTSPGVDVFDRVFKSPICAVCSPVHLTVSVFENIFTWSVPQLRDEYYDKVVEEYEANQEEKGKKHGLISRLPIIGSAFNKNGELRPENIEQEKPTGNMPESAVPSTDEKPVESATNSGVNMPENTRSESAVKNEVDTKDSSLETGAVFGQQQENMSENQLPIGDDDYLGIGNYGVSHSDTGFLDESEVSNEGRVEPEKNGYSESTESENRNVGNRNVNNTQYSESKDLENRTYENRNVKDSEYPDRYKTENRISDNRNTNSSGVSEITENRNRNINSQISEGYKVDNRITKTDTRRNSSETGKNGYYGKSTNLDNGENRSEMGISHADSGKLRLDIKSFPKVVFFLGERGTGVTSSIVDLACDLYRGGENILIVDADYRRNGILSFIDVRDFYEKGKDDGIDNINPYSDEDADILSNGYGVDISKARLYSAIASREMQEKYDRVFVDCPLDCINSLSERLVKIGSVLLLVDGSLTSLISTSIGLTDKKVIETNLESYIMKNAVVGVIHVSDTLFEDIDYVKSTVLFPNGCWLDNIQEG